MYDLIFLGGGPAGYEGAIAAAKKNLRAAVVEKNRVGGTCLHWGCIPTKTYLHTARLIRQLKSARRLGVEVGDITINLDKLKKQKHRVVTKLTKGIEYLFKQYGVDFLEGCGRIVGAHEVEVDGKQRLEARHLVIATGTVPAELPFLSPDGGRVTNSDGALEPADIPHRLLVVGAGAVGVEMALIYRYLGAEVTLVEVMEQILPGMEDELAARLSAELKKQKIEVKTGTSVSEPDSDSDDSTVSLLFRQDGREWRDTYDRVLLAVGRKPVTDGLWDPALGIRTDRQGFIAVDDELRTAVESIRACGDVTGPPLLAHRASHQAIAIVNQVASGSPVSHTVVPGAVFSFPELASVGATEKEARASGEEIRIGRFPYAGGSRSTAIDEKSGLVKIVARHADGAVLGAHILGAEAGELMPLLTYAVDKQLPAGDLRDLIFIHPTLSENVREALGEIGGFSIHI